MAELHCSFCGLPKKDMIEGLNGYICYDCLEAAMENIPIENSDDVNFMKPHQIKEEYYQHMTITRILIV